MREPPIGRYPYLTELLSDHDSPNANRLWKFPLTLHLDKEISHLQGLSHGFLAFGHAGQTMRSTYA